MSQNLTQPEEVEKIFKEMAGLDMKADAPNQNGLKVSRAPHDFACDWSTGVTDYSSSVAQKYIRN